MVKTMTKPEKRVDAPVSERKRVTIPAADQSALDWWNAQHDPSLSVRLLIRAEIARTGYADVAYHPVEQQPRRGRPATSGSDADGSQDASGQDEAGTAPATPAPAPRAEVRPEPELVPDPAQIPVPEPALVSASSAPRRNPIDDIMNG